MLFWADDKGVLSDAIASHLIPTPDRTCLSWTSANLIGRAGAVLFGQLGPVGRNALGGTATR